MTTSGPAHPLGYTPPPEHPKPGASSASFSLRKPTLVSPPGKNSHNTVKADRIAIVAADFDDAQTALAELTQKYTTVEPQDADVIVALGGDGFVLQTLRHYIDRKVPVFGMNRGSIGFLMNDYRTDDLPRRVANAQPMTLYPLRMRATTLDGSVHESLAINEVSLLRQTYQAAKLEIQVNDVVRMPELICDGALVSTAAGSTAYNLSADGPIIPLSAEIMALALTPISAFRPRRWRGALLPHTAHVRFKVLDNLKRPVSATADDTEVRDVVQVDVSEERESSFRLLFDPETNLEERILKEQFAP
ncbi:MAG: NAD kinase [Alphaproteobacteria bacterium]|nr:NAD kinase [Alphaproteobacteria bacterium]